MVYWALLGLNGRSKVYATSGKELFATQLNAEGVPTLSGTGTWQKGTIGNLLAQEA